MATRDIVEGGSEGWGREKEGGEEEEGEEKEKKLTRRSRGEVSLVLGGAC